MLLAHLLSCSYPTPADRQGAAPMAPPVAPVALGGPPVRLAEAAQIPQGGLDDAVIGISYHGGGLDWQLLGWTRLAVRLPAAAEVDDLWLMTPAHPVALAPEALSAPTEGTSWAIFRIPLGAPQAFTLYVGEEPQAFRADPILFNTSSSTATWGYPRSFEGCTPGRWAVQEAAVSFYPVPERSTSADRQRPDGWSADGGTARWQVRFPCPAPREGDELQHGNLTMAGWTHVQSVESPAGDWSCVGGLVGMLRFDTTVGRQEAQSREWNFADPNDVPGDRFTCDAELRAALPERVRNGSGRWRADWVVRSQVLDAPPPPLEPPDVIELVRPPPPVAAPRVPQRALVDHLDTDVVDLLWEEEWKPALAGTYGWPACDAVEQAAAEAALGDLQRCTASAGLVYAQYGHAKAVGRVLDGAFQPVDPEVWQWFQSPQEDLLRALFVPWIVGGNDREGLAVWCRSLEPIEARGTTQGRVGRAVFDGDEGCLVSWDTRAPHDANGRARRYGVVMELGLSGSLWVKDDGFMDGSELTLAPGRIEYVTWTHTESDNRRLIASRREVVGRPAAPPAGPPCATPNIRGSLPHLSRVCGGEQGPTMLGVVGADGHASDVRFLALNALDARWEACAREAVLATELTPGSCVALPFARATW